MNFTTIKKTTTKAKTSIDFIEDAFGFEPFTRKDYESRLDRVVSRWYGRHYEYFTIETLLKYDIIKVVKVETFKRVEVDSWDEFIMDNNRNKIIANELWEVLTPELRNQIVSVAEDNGTDIGYEAKRFYYAYTGIDIDTLINDIEEKALVELRNIIGYARRLV